MAVRFLALVLGLSLLLMAWVRYYVDNSRHDIYDWLDELGVRFSEVLASSGNSVPREHQPVGR